MVSACADLGDAPPSRTGVGTGGTSVPVGGTGGSGGFGGGSVVGGSGVDCQGPGEMVPERPLTLTADQVAIRLADFLWRKPADAALLAKVAAAAPRTTRDVAALATEMQKDDRFLTAMDLFARSWLELDRLSGAMPKTVPDFDQALVADMTEESLRFFRFVLGDSAGTFGQLLTAPLTFVNGRLAALYGMPDVVGAEWRQVSLDARQRAGVSTLLGRLTADPTTTRRGGWVLRALQCGPSLPGHPAGIPTQITSAEQFRKEMTEGPACKACHTNLDPWGFPFDHFDDVGRFAPTSIDLKGSGSLPDGSTLQFDGPASLMSALASSCDVQRCFVKQMLSFASAAVRPDADPNVVIALSAFRKSGWQLRSLIVAITQTPGFLAP